MDSFEVIQIPVLNDNYIYLIHDAYTSTTARVDPAKAEPVIKELKSRGWKLDFILNTHHHADHVGGNKQLKEHYSCKVLASEHDHHRIPGITSTLQEGDKVTVGSLEAYVYFVPGHTSGHIAYHFRDQHALFCGDTLFSIGCGRLFEGTPIQMWDSLKKLRNLPDHTKVYCTHEYTEQNIRFALSIDPHNQALKHREQEVLMIRSQNLPSVPSLLGQEKLANPFLRADDKTLQSSLGFNSTSPEDFFGELRKRKDLF